MFSVCITPESCSVTGRLVLREWWQCLQGLSRGLSGEALCGTPTFLMHIISLGGLVSRRSVESAGERVRVERKSPLDQS